MTYFLTSSPFGDNGGLNPANGFVEELKKDFCRPMAGLFVCSDPEDHPGTDGFAGAVRESFMAAGFGFTSYTVLDGRNSASAAQLTASAQVVILAGGHVPTQNRFFAETGLRELLRGFSGVLIGISAGTMNSADTVYAQPELPGEAASKDYRRFLTGLGITRAMVLPHYQAVKDSLVDGLRAFEDVAYPDSRGRCFYALPDGSYILGRNGAEELRGLAWSIRDGIKEQVCPEGGAALL